MGPFSRSADACESSALVATHGRSTIRPSGSNIVHQVLSHSTYFLQILPATVSTVCWKQTSPIKDARFLHRDLCQRCPMFFPYLARPSRARHFQQIVSYVPSHLVDEILGSQMAGAQCDEQQRKPKCQTSASCSDGSGTKGFIRALELARLRWRNANIYLHFVLVCSSHRNTGWFCHRNDLGTSMPSTTCGPGSESSKSDIVPPFQQPVQFDE